MSIDFPAYFALANDVLQAIIVIFGTAVILYNTSRLWHAEVIRAFCALIGFVVIVYLTELSVSRTIVSTSAESWLRVGWVGIAMVPAAQFHLSSTLLSVTGSLPNRRKFLVPAGYLLGVLFAILGVTSNLIVGEISRLDQSSRLTAGPCFWLFVLYFWVVTFSSIYNVWRSRRRCLTSTTRRRMTNTLIAFLAAPLGVFPYLLLTGNPQQDVPLFAWPVLILGNLVVSVMFSILTSQLTYFGDLSPDRVVRVRLYKFMARVPFTASILLLVYVLVGRTSRFLGLPTKVSLGFALVATVMIVEWAIHAFKRPLERFFHLDDDPDIRRIQNLSERLLTRKEMHQFLESILAASCEAIRTPTAFVAAITSDGPKLEAVVGPLANPDSELQDAELMELADARAKNSHAENGLVTADDFILWQDFWIRPLTRNRDNLLLGIMGIRARADEPDLSTEENDMLSHLVGQASKALEDRILQQEVFAAVDGLLLEVTSLQARQKAAAYGGLPALSSAISQEDGLAQDPSFTRSVRDALSHYWGGPKLTQSPLMRLNIVQEAMQEHNNNPSNALRAILTRAIEQQKPEGQRSMTTAEWILYNILELKFVQGKRVRDVARRLAMSESDLYRKQRVAIENVAHTIANMEQSVEDV